MSLQLLRREAENIKIVGRKTLTKIFVTVQDNGQYRIRTNQVLENLIQGDKYGRVY